MSKARKAYKPSALIAHIPPYRYAEIVDGDHPIKLAGDFYSVEHAKIFRDWLTEAIRYLERRKK